MTRFNAVTSPEVSEREVKNRDLSRRIAAEGMVLLENNGILPLDLEGKKIRKQLEVDFVVNTGEKRFYIQSALSIANPEKKEQEIASFKRIPDSFRKIVVVKDYLKPWQDENGIVYIGIEQFLLGQSLF